MDNLVSTDTSGDVLQRVVDNAYHGSSTSFGGSATWENSFLYRLLFPGAIQEKEFGQQVALQNEMLRYNDPSNQVARLIKAGLNPNLAAGAIAGNGTPSVSSPPSSPSSPLPSEGLANVAGALNQTASAYDTLYNVDTHNELMRSQTRQFLAGAGVDEATATLLAAKIPFASVDAFADVLGKFVTIRNCAAEYNNIRQQFSNLQAEYESIIANKDLMRSQEDINKAMKEKLDIEVWFAQKDKEYWLSHGIRIDDDRDSAILHSYFNNGPDASQEIMDFFTNYQKKLEVWQAQLRLKENWGQRPSNAIEAVWYVTGMVKDVLLNNKSKLKDLFQKGVTSLKEIRQDQQAYNEFKDLYDEAYDTLEDSYKAAKKLYRQYKYSGASDSTIAQLKAKRDSLKKELDEFTEDKFMDILFQKDLEELSRLPNGK